MPTVPEIFPPLVRTVLTFAPWLEEIPVIGAILVTFAGGGGDETHAIQELIRLAKQHDQDRKDRIMRNARYVLKASDAMACVNDNLNEGATFYALAKAFINNVAGKPGTDAGEILTNKIFTCIESKTLKQTNPRIRRTGTFRHRPSRGHG